MINDILRNFRPKENCPIYCLLNVLTPIFVCFSLGQRVLLDQANPSIEVFCCPCLFLFSCTFFGAESAVKVDWHRCRRLYACVCVCVTGCVMQLKQRQIYVLVHRRSTPANNQQPDAKSPQPSCRTCSVRLNEIFCSKRPLRRLLVFALEP